MIEAKRPLRVFLCHASVDKLAVTKLYEHLVDDGVDAWLDKEKLIPGQDWRFEISKAVKTSDVVIVCLTSQSVTKEGFVQKEIKIALDAADEKPEGTIFIIPARLENCAIPERISQFHWVDLFLDNGYERLLKALELRAAVVGALLEKNSSVDLKSKIKSPTQKKKKKHSTSEKNKKVRTVKRSVQFTIVSWIGISLGFISLLAGIGLLGSISPYAFWVAAIGFLIFTIERITKQIKLSITSWVAIVIGVLGFMSGFGFIGVFAPYAYWLVFLGFSIDLLHKCAIIGT